MINTEEWEVIWTERFDRYGRPHWRLLVTAKEDTGDEIEEGDILEHEGTIYKVRNADRHPSPEHHLITTIVEPVWKPEKTWYQKTFNIEPDPPRPPMPGEVVQKIGHMLMEGEDYEQSGE